MLSKAVGSSPLARGLHDHGLRLRPGGGIIPARAGFTRGPGALRSMERDHPRSRGVYVEAEELRRPVEGSSPLARGLPPTALTHSGRMRIIPARAGFTRPHRHHPRPVEDHPRSRGVYLVFEPVRQRRRGSSPLARGLRRAWVARTRHSGIIPARAGFTCARTWWAGSPADHPRSRGVYSRSAVGTRATGGSSPLARGLPRGAEPSRLLPRIIPARAGFTDGAQPVERKRRDHPRSRGVYHPLRPATDNVSGSSPLARGLQPTMEENTMSPRIIPARAGFTGDGAHLLEGGGDHPRSRGVYPLGRGCRRRRSGSSPLARGLR